MMNRISNVILEDSWIDKYSIKNILGIERKRRNSRNNNLIRIKIKRRILKRIMRNNQLSRYNAVPRLGQMKLLKRVYEYLHNYPTRSIITEGKDYPDFISNLDAKRQFAPGCMKSYYQDSLYEDFTDGPKEKGKPVEVSISVDSSHGDDKMKMDQDQNLKP